MGQRITPPVAAVATGAKPCYVLKVADAAHEQGYVGEAWGTLKGDRIRAMHGLYMGVSYALNKSVAIQLDVAQMKANRAYVTSKFQARRAFRPRRRRCLRPQSDTRDVVRDGSIAASENLLEAACVAPGQT